MKIGVGPKPTHGASGLTGEKASLAGKPCSLCGRKGHDAKTHLYGNGTPKGKAVVVNKATQFDTSSTWAGGGKGSKYTQGSESYEPPDKSSEGGMS